MVVLLAVPVLVTLSAALTRRFGHAVGGVVTGLPLTSAPLSISLALAHGPPFAARAAAASLLGIAASTGSLAVYGGMARTRSPLPAALAGLATFFGGIAVGLPLHLGLVAAATAGAAVAAAADSGLGRIAPPRAPRPAALGILPRAVGALGVAGIVAVVAHAAGAAVAGAITPLPVVSGTMTVHAHRDAGPGAAVDVVRGSARGTYGFVAFFVVAALLLGRAPLLAAYAAATLTAVAVGAIGAATSRT